jgi:hypothetical protein
MYGWVTSDAGSPRTTIPRYADYFVAFTTSFAFGFLRGGKWGLRLPEIQDFNRYPTALSKSSRSP